MGYTKAEVAKPGTAGIAMDVVTTGKGGLNERGPNPGRQAIKIL